MFYSPLKAEISPLYGSLNLPAMNIILILQLTAVLKMFYFMPLKLTVKQGCLQIVLG
jgi:hypothetical protein